MSGENFEPKIIGFLCNWCSYAGADLAGTSRMKYAPNQAVDLVKIDLFLIPKMSF